LIAVIERRGFSISGVEKPFEKISDNFLLLANANNSCVSDPLAVYKLMTSILFT
jgi:hypothetical protein